MARGGLPQMQVVRSWFILIRVSIDINATVRLASTERSAKPPAKGVGSSIRINSLALHVTRVRGGRSGRPSY